MANLIDKYMEEKLLDRYGLQKEVLSLDLADLDFSVRTYNALRHFGVYSVSDLASLTPKDMKRARNFGVKSAMEVDKVLCQHGTVAQSQLGVSLGSLINHTFVTPYIKRGDSIPVPMAVNPTLNNKPGSGREQDVSSPSQDYLQKLQDAFEALSAALDAVDAAEAKGVKTHPSIGNRISTAKLILAEVLADISKDTQDRVSPAMHDAQQNTKIHYMYRDAGNWKVYNECVIKGQLTPEQQKDVLSCLEDGEYFIPSLVGLPETKFGECDADLDHELFELHEGDFVPTSREPDINITADELVKRFAQFKGNWIKPVCLKPSLSEQLQAAEARTGSVPAGNPVPAKNNTYVR